ncbi:hypothetical protein [Saccharothrix sp. Mg75]|uniref:hypothetical protein n=1 Tax=Saccharothrix sp. Mg75 TaxID=3445357 RepID=UPI003EECB88A
MLLASAGACVVVQVVAGFLVGGDGWWWVGATGFVVGGTGFALVYRALRVRDAVLGAALFLGLGLPALTAITGPPLWSAWFGERDACVVVDRVVAQTARDDDEERYVLSCDGRGVVDALGRGVRPAVVGDRVPLVFDRLGVMAPVRPEDVSTAGAWLVPPAAAAVAWFVVLTARRTRGPGAPWTRRASRWS